MFFHSDKSFELKEMKKRERLDKEAVKEEYAKNPCYTDVAKKFGVSRQRIYQIITGYGPKKKTDWWFLQADWSKSNKELAREFKKHVYTVSIARRRLGKEGLKWWQSPEINWSDNNVKIAKQTGMTAPAVRYIRKKYIEKRK